jgi:rfaE bifunctional protein kinase chain/domain
LGSFPFQIGVIGADPFGEALAHALTERGINADHLVIDPQRPTTTKTRLMAHMGLRFPQQVARLDRIDRRPINGAVEAAVISNIKRQAIGTTHLVASDYLSGLLTSPVVAAIRAAGLDNGAFMAADAQGELDKYIGFDLVKCNADEAIAYRRQPLSSDADFAEAGRQIVSALQLRGAMLITRGQAGLTLAEANGTVTHIRAPHVEDVFDTVGAGDTALAVMTLALIAEASYPEAAALANFAAGFVVRKVGNYAPTAAELRWAIQTWNIAGG